MIEPGLCQCGCGGRTKTARGDDPRYGTIKGEPLRFINGHNRRLSPHEYILNSRTRCWEWQRSTNGVGYGQMRIGGRSVYAHRHYYELAKGPIPLGLHLDHLCNNPSCVNPDHLEAVTQAENNRRAIRLRAYRQIRNQVATLQWPKEKASA